MITTPLYLLAGFFAFWGLSARLVPDKSAARFWMFRVAVAVAAGLLLAKLTPVYTHWEVVFNDPILLVFLSGGLGGLVGGTFMGGTVLAVSLYEARQHWPVKPAQLLAPVAAGAVVFLLLWSGELLLTPAPSPLSEQARQTLIPQPGQKDTAVSRAQGKLLVLNFTSPGFLPSVAESFDLAAYTKRHGPSTVVWTVDVTAGDSRALRRLFGVETLPLTLVFDRQGTLVERRATGADLPWLLSLEFRYGR